MTTRTRPSTRTTVRFPSVALGAGHYYQTEGGYAIAKNGDGSSGRMMPGLLEVADKTGVPTGYRIFRQFEDYPAVGSQTRVMVSGNNTIVYTSVGGAAWSDPLDTDVIITGAATDTAIFGGRLFIAFGASTAWMFSGVDNTVMAPNTYGGNETYANYFLSRKSGLTAPQLVWVRNNNTLYAATDPASASAVTTLTVGDSSGTTGVTDFFNGLAQDDTGRIYIGKRDTLYTLTAEGLPVAIFRCKKAPTDAGGQSDSANFQRWDELDGRVYFIVEGYHLLEVYRGNVTRYMAPGHDMFPNDPEIPRANLPLNAVTAARGWLYLAMGSKNSATLKSVTHTHGGGALYQNTFSVTSDLWKGRYFGDQWVWHGVILECTDPLRGMHFSFIDDYLYLFSGDSEAADVQARRAYLLPDPLHAVKSSNIHLATGEILFETGLIRGQDYEMERLLRIRCEPLYPLASATPSVAILYRYLPPEDTSAYTTLVTHTNSYEARRWATFPRNAIGRGFHLQFALTGLAGSPNTYAILENAELELEPWFSS